MILRIAGAVLLGLVTACGGDPSQELLDTAQFEERQMNQPHAKQLYEEILRRYPSSKAAETARARLAELNHGR